MYVKSNSQMFLIQRHFHRHSQSRLSLPLSILPKFFLVLPHLVSTVDNIRPLFCHKHHHTLRVVAPPLEHLLYPHLPFFRHHSLFLHQVVSNESSQDQLGSYPHWYCVCFIDLMYAYMYTVVHTCMCIWPGYRTQSIDI